MRRTIALVTAAVVTLAMACPIAAADEDRPTDHIPAGAVDSARAGQKDRGFTLGVSLQSTMLMVNGGSASSSFSIAGIQGGVLAGYKLDRFIFGLSIGLARIANGSSTSVGGTTTESSQAFTNLVIAPGVRVALVRSADRRVELFGQFDIGWGRSFSEQSPSQDTSNTQTGNNRLVYDVGPGVRYWVHPQFALAASTAVRGDFNWTTTSNSSGGVTSSNTRSTGATGITGGLEFLGVF